MWWCGSMTFGVCTCVLCEDCRHLHTERTYTHQMLCCCITTLTFTFLTNFKISNFNKEHTSSLKMIWIRSKHAGAFLSVLMWTFYTNILLYIEVHCWCVKFSELKCTVKQWNSVSRLLVSCKIQYYPIVSCSGTMAQNVFGFLISSEKWYVIYSETTLKAALFFNTCSFLIAFTIL